ncbi:MAG: hypothetical protein Q9175_006620 [Cornicularia normoerica]
MSTFKATIQPLDMAAYTDYNAYADSIREDAKKVSLPEEETSKNPSPLPQSASPWDEVPDVKTPNTSIYEFSDTPAIWQSETGSSGEHNAQHELEKTEVASGLEVQGSSAEGETGELQSEEKGEDRAVDEHGSDVTPSDLFNSPNTGLILSSSPPLTPDSSVHQQGQITPPPFQPASTHVGNPTQNVTIPLPNHQAPNPMSVNTAGPTGRIRRPPGWKRCEEHRRMKVNITLTFSSRKLTLSRNAVPACGYLNPVSTSRSLEKRPRLQKSQRTKLGRGEGRRHFDMHQATEPLIRWRGGYDQ